MCRIAPFVVVALVAGLYLLVQKRRGKLESEADRRQALDNCTYSLLLFIYVIMPSVSTSVITFFSCQEFDRGDRQRRTWRQRT